MIGCVHCGKDITDNNYQSFRNTSNGLQILYLCPNCIDDMFVYPIERVAVPCDMCGKTHLDCIVMWDKRKKERLSICPDCYTKLKRVV
jgi:ribosomal protein S27E